MTDTSIKTLPPALGLSALAANGEELIVSHPPLDPHLHIPFEAYALADSRQAGLLASYRPPFLGWEHGIWRLDAGIAAGGGVAFKNTRGEARLMVDAGVSQSGLNATVGPVAFRLLPELRLMNGAASTLTSWNPSYEFLATLTALEAGPRDHSWAVGLGGTGSVSAPRTEVAGGGLLSFAWRGKAETPVHQVKLAEVREPSTPPNLSEYFDELSLSELAHQDVSDMQGFLGADGKPLSGITNPAVAITHFGELVNSKTPADFKGKTIVFNIPNLPDKSGKLPDRAAQLSQLRRSLLYLFLAGDEKTNPYYNRFQQFRFLIPKENASLARPQDDKLMCGSVPGLDEQGDRIAEFLFNQGIRKVTIVNVLSDCRSQGAPLDYGPIDQDFLQLSTLLTGMKSDTDIMGAIQKIISQKGPQGFVGVERLRRLAEDSLSAMSLKPLSDGLIRHHWAPRVYLEVTNPSLYTVLRHELGHTLIHWKDGSAQHPWALDGYVEEGNSTQEKVTGWIGKDKKTSLEAFKQLLTSDAARQFWKKNPLFPVLYLGNLDGGAPTEKEIRLTLEKEEDVQKILGGLKRGELTWVEQGLYLQNSGIWQLKMNVDAALKPDATQPARFSHMTDSNETAPIDPILFKAIRQILDEE